MQPEEASVGRRRIAERLAAAARAWGGWRGSTRKSRRGCSSLVSAICVMPAMERLLGGMRILAAFSPGVETVVEDEPRQMGERDIGRGDRRAIGGRPR